MNKARELAQKLALDILNSISKDNISVQRYQELWSKMSDKEFDDFISELESGKRHFTLTVPNFADNSITVENNIKVAEKLGFSFWEKLVIGPSLDMPQYITPIEYMVVALPVKRQSQLLTKKLSVPENNKVVNILTGQATSSSQASKVSLDEVRILTQMNMNNSIVELYKFRGGDTGGWAAMNAMFNRYGIARLKDLMPYATGVESSHTLKSYFFAMHLKNNLI